MATHKLRLIPQPEMLATVTALKRDTAAVVDRQRDAACTPQTENREAQSGLTPAPCRIPRRNILRAFMQRL
jgi:hypothetical protein